MPHQHLYDRFPGAALQGLSEEDGGVMIPGISVMTEGPAESHFVRVGDGPEAKEFQLFIDATTIEQVIAQAATYANGVKVKANHKSGVQDVIGRLTNFTLSQTPEGKKQAKADFHLFKTSPLFAHMLNLMKTIPDAIGFSAFMDGPVQRIGDMFFSRCKELYSVDLVGEPSTNPSGVFSIPVDNMQKDESAATLPTMEPDAIKQACEAAIKPHMDSMATRMSALEAGHAKMAKHVKLDAADNPAAGAPNNPSDEAAMYSRFLEKATKDPVLLSMVKATMTAELQDTAKTLTALGLTPGTGPRSSVGDGANPGAGAKKIEDMSFMEIVAVEFGKTENASRRDYEIIHDLAMAHPVKHKAALNARELGKLPVRTVKFKAA